MGQHEQKEIFESTLIAISKVGILPTHRAADAKGVKALAQSIDKLGLLQAIGVVPDEQCPGEFILVFGRHRLEACKLLGREVIEARVFDFDPADAEAAMIVENLHRNELDKKARFDAAEKFVTWHKEKFPEMHGSGAYQQAPPDATDDQKSGARLLPPEGSQPVADEPKAKAKKEPKPSKKSAAAAYSEETGRGLTRSKQDVRIAEKLSKDQRSILIDRGVIDDDLYRISLVDDEEKRAKVVVLISSGMDVDTAIAAGTAPPNAIVEVVPKEVVPTVKPEAEMTDDEWLNFYCADALTRIRHRPIYAADAAFYRRSRKVMADFKSRMRTPLSESKVGPIARGLFHSLVARVCHISHPKDWLMCGPCNGTGLSGNRSECSKCGGRGYAITTESK